MRGAAVTLTLAAACANEVRLVPDAPAGATAVVLIAEGASEGVIEPLPIARPVNVEGERVEAHFFAEVTAAAPILRSSHCEAGDLGAPLSSWTLEESGAVAWEGPPTFYSAPSLGCAPGAAGSFVPLDITNECRGVSAAEVGCELVVDLEPCGERESSWPRRRDGTVCAPRPADPSCVSSRVAPDDALAAASCGDRPYALIEHAEIGLEVRGKDLEAELTAAGVPRGDQTIIDFLVRDRELFVVSGRHHSRRFMYCGDDSETLTMRIDRETWVVSDVRPGARCLFGLVDAGDGGYYASYQAPGQGNYEMSIGRFDATSLLVDTASFSSPVELHNPQGVWVAEIVDTSTTPGEPDLTVLLTAGVFPGPEGRAALLRFSGRPLRHRATALIQGIVQQLHFDPRTRELIFPDDYGNSWRTTRAPIASPLEEGLAFLASTSLATSVGPLVALSERNTWLMTLGGGRGGIYVYRERGRPPALESVFIRALTALPQAIVRVGPTSVVAFYQAIPDQPQTSPLWATHIDLNDTRPIRPGARAVVIGEGEVHRARAHGGSAWALLPFDKKIVQLTKAE